MKLLALLLGALGFAPTAVERAALLQFRGDAAAALSAADTILAKDPQDARALFVAACAAVEAGDLDRASVYTGRLEQHGRDPHVVVLKRLIERRRERKDEPLREALVLAWRDTGRPDLSGNRILRESESWGQLVPKIDRPVRARLTAGERFMFDGIGSATSAAYVKAAIRAAADAEKQPVVVNLDVLGALTPFAAIKGIDAQAASRAAAHVGRVVVAAEPDNGYMELASLLAAAPGTVPFNADDLSAIERALGKPRFEYPREGSLTQLRQLAAHFDPGHAELRAWSAALGASVPLFRLWQRAEAVKDPELRVRAGRVLQAVGLRLREAGTALEKSLSFALEVKGAELRGDAAAVEAAKAARAQWWAWHQATEDARRRMGNWPFAAGWREWTPAGEVAYMRKLTD
ncbi:hypothetical protein A2cp1_0384 [Anaeromyxobacter dehalogenans 2CP-1]|uniref:Tetratricopeptide repeat protein n=1 Tax=Anaeromyxobacter dehalogenans (strain ATCC BAA-258 / DSM 21875 / 2CP-1) TaxID=455488 RepID=B8JA38_ANAD2|nr:hypothetical protein [Anaeromyxobacter dehalogenans]ACL63741.1 hypothetical protein A2cp1_0384 [Anaeromyxobacter dehalogenans 2CP-1]